MAHPPSTARIWPVTKDDSSEARNRTARATSCGLPTRLKRALLDHDLAAPGLGRMRSAVSGVSIRPGATAFTRMPEGPKSVAIWRVMPMTAAFDTE